MTTIAAPSVNECQDELAASFTRGTSTAIVLDDGALFPNPAPLGHVVRIESGSKWCLVIYDDKTGDDQLDMSAADDYPIALNYGGGATTTEVFPIGSTVSVVCAADEIAQVMQDVRGVTTKTAAATLTTAEAGTVLVSCAATPYTITLPTASGNSGLTYRFIKTDANYNLITLDGDGSETFNYENANGAAQTTYPRLNTYCAEVTVVSDGTNWQCINERMGQVPQCKVYLSADQDNLSDSTWTVVELDTEEYDIGSNFNTTTHRFTAPIDGIYHVVFCGGFVGSSLVADKVYAFAVREGGDTFKATSYLHSSLASAMAVNGTTYIELSADEYIEEMANSLSGTNTVDLSGTAIKTSMSVRLVSKT